MPYIPKHKRAGLEPCGKPYSEGELNYTITRTLDRWLSEFGVNYSNINAAVGVLECAKLELYRRIAAPYEDVKQGMHGDAYTVTSGG